MRKYVIERTVPGPGRMRATEVRAVIDPATADGAR